MEKHPLFIVRTIRNTQIHCVGSSYLTGNTLSLRYRAQQVNAIWGNSRCLFWERYETEVHSLGSSHLTGNTLPVIYRDQPVNAVRAQTVSVYSENHIQRTVHRLREQRPNAVTHICADDRHPQQKTRRFGNWVCFLPQVKKERRILFMVP
jgi:hypothetical protein